MAIAGESWRHNFIYGHNVTGKNLQREDRSDSTNLISNTEKNYVAAMNYYKQKEEIFLSKAINKFQMELNEVRAGMQKAMNDLIQNSWQTIDETIIQSTGGSNGKARKTNGKYEIDESQLVHLPDVVQEYFLQGKASGNIYSQLGFAYEDYIKFMAAAGFSDVKDENLRSLLVYFLKNLNKTGALKTASALRQNAEIRADVAVGKMIQGTDAQGNKVLYGYDSKGKKLAVELQMAFDIQSELEKNGGQGLDGNFLLEKYKNSPMAGFSMKRWTNDLYNGSKHLTSISGLRDILNSSEHFGNDKFWNPIYAQKYMINMVSRFLLNILGPINIGFILGSGFIWTSEFLNDALLYMNIYVDSTTNNSNDRSNIKTTGHGGYYEIKPKIGSGNVYVTRLENGRVNAINSLQASKLYNEKATNKKGREVWRGWQLQFKMNRQDLQGAQEK